MIPDYLAPLANHLWQSTIFTLFVGLLALALRKNRAAVRYKLWLAASIKFLVPFSLLVSVGSQIHWRTAAPVAMPPLSFTITEISQPFAVPIDVPAIPVPVKTPDRVPMVLFCIWLVGAVVSLVPWFSQWRSIRRMLRAAQPLHWDLPIRVVSCAGNAEPGVFGIFRPVLLLPDGIADRLTPSELQAILSHELCHVRRRDNLSALIHMVVEFLFWFHPLVWWIENRLTEEQENACDEEVLSLGNDPQIYAEGILKVCRFYLASPLVCVAKVTGSDLRRRVEAIMGESAIQQLNAGRKVLLVSAAIVVLAVPLSIGILTAPLMHTQSTVGDTPIWQTAAGGKMSFEVASVRVSDPDKITRPNFPLGADDAYQLPDGTRPTGGRFVADFPVARYITFAYKVALTNDQLNELLSGLPKWVNMDRFTIQAKTPMDNPTKDQMRVMMQSLLAERFKLAVHFEMKESPVLALSLVKPGTPGPQLRPHAEGPPCDSVASVFPAVCNLAGIIPAGGRFPAADGKTVVKASDSHMALAGARNVTMDQAAASFASILGGGRPVVDQTGLEGMFDYTVEWTPEPGDRLAFPGATAADSPGTTLITALREQLGLKVQSTKASLRALVIDHVEKPTDSGSSNGLETPSPSTAALVKPVAKTAPVPQAKPMGIFSLIGAKQTESRIICDTVGRAPTFDYTILWPSAGAGPS